VFVEIDLISHCRKRCTKDPAVPRTRTREAAAETSRAASIAASAPSEAIRKFSHTPESRPEGSRREPPVRLRATPPCPRSPPTRPI
jgi:hypothetical protein